MNLKVATSWQNTSRENFDLDCLKDGNHGKNYHKIWKINNFLYCSQVSRREFNCFISKKDNNLSLRYSRLMMSNFGYSQLSKEIYFLKKLSSYITKRAYFITGVRIFWVTLLTNMFQGYFAKESYSLLSWANIWFHFQREILNLMFFWQYKCQNKPLKYLPLPQWSNYYKCTVLSWALSVKMKSFSVCSPSTFFLFFSLWLPDLRNMSLVKR